MARSLGGIRTWSSGDAASRPPARGARRRLQVGIAVEQRYLSQREPSELAAALARRGHRVTLLDPASPAWRGDDAVARLARLDVVVARGRSAAVLALLRQAEGLGLPAVNRPDAIALVHDKLEMARVLSAGQVPTPRTRAASLRDLLASARAATFPLVVKPVRGDNGRDVVLLRSRRELERLRWSEGIALAQPLVPGDGRDLKLYVAGGAVWAMHKPSLLFHRDWRAGLPEPTPVTAEMRALALRCGALFGLDIYGVDCVESTHGLVVIEVNDFPNYTGLSEADGRMADLVIARASAAGARARSAP